MTNFNIEVNSTLNDNKFKLGNKVCLTELIYEDVKGATDSVEINQSALSINQNPFVFAYTTKINDKRWGVQITITNGVVEVECDKGSPIKSISLKLEEV